MIPSSPQTDEQEENELILKLAWFLDRLAYLSGYEPEYKDYNYYEPRGSTRKNSFKILCFFLIYVMKNV